MKFYFLHVSKQEGILVHRDLCCVIYLLWEMEQWIFISFREISLLFIFCIWVLMKFEFNI